MDIFICVFIVLNDLVPDWVFLKEDTLCLEMNWD